MDKITFSDYEAPGVGADNLNQLQDNIEEGIEGTVIYSNSSGSNTNITFSSAITNADFIEIIYNRLNVKKYTTGKLPYTNGMSTTLHLTFPAIRENPNDTRLQISTTDITINNTGIVFNGGLYANLISSGVSEFGLQTDIYIEKVIIYK